MSLTIATAAVVHHTFVIEREYPYSAERVFAAFSDPAQKRRWFLDAGGHQDGSFELDFRVGGLERSVARIATGPYTGTPFTYEATFLDIVPNARLVCSSTMALGERRISASLTTFEFQSGNGGTRLLFTHQGAFFEGADGPQMREGGWNQLLGHLTAHLEPHSH